MPDIETIEDLKEHIFSGKGAEDFLDEGEEIQLQVKENNKKEGSPIFVREDGKVGFPTFNSIAIQIGDIVRGKIKFDTDHYFFVEVHEIVTRETE
jgi:hypothetical protein